MESDTKTAVLKAILMTLGIGAGVFFVLTKVPPAFDWALHPATKGQVLMYGDLYRDAKITAFRPLVPLSAPRFPPENPEPTDDAVNRTKNFLFGDSFSLLQCGGPQFGDQVAARIGDPVMTLSYYAYPNPLTFLRAHRLDCHLPRVVVFEVVERQIDWRFHDRFATNGVVLAARTKAFGAAGPAESWPSQLKRILFADTARKHEFLFRNSCITFPMAEWWNTLWFHAAGVSPDLVPLYSSDPAFLFPKTEVDTYFEPHSEEMIDHLAENIALLAGDLRTSLNCEFVFVPVPDKLTLYHRAATRYEYDGYLPRLCGNLRRRGVRVIELLPHFQEEKELLFFSTDTHWNVHGVKIAVEELVKAWPLGVPGIVEPRSGGGALTAR